MRQHVAYKSFIDQLVEISRVDTTAKRIRENGHGERTNECDLPLSETEHQRKTFLLSLNSNQHIMLAEMLEEARTGAIHDFASYLEWAISCDQMTLNWKGENIPSSPYTTMHYDFICRNQGDTWPDDKEQR
jgi:hypothetical protein